MKWRGKRKWKKNYCFFGFLLPFTVMKSRKKTSNKIYINIKINEITFFCYITRFLCVCLSDVSLYILFSLFNTHTLTQTHTHTQHIHSQNGCFQLVSPVFVCYSSFLFLFRVFTSYYVLMIVVCWLFCHYAPLDSKFKKKIKTKRNNNNIYLFRLLIALVQIERAHLRAIDIIYLCIFFFFYYYDYIQIKFMHEFSLSPFIFFFFKNSILLQRN